MDDVHEDNDLSKDDVTHQDNAPEDKEIPPKNDEKALTLKNNQYLIIFFERENN